MSDSITEIGADNLLTPSQVAALFNVSPRTVAEWGRTGRLPCVRTPGGHRRFPESGVRALMARTADTEGVPA